MIAETILATTIICSVSPAARKRTEQEFHYFSGQCSNSFIVATGCTLEDQVIDKVEQIPGVYSVDISRSGSIFSVKVVLEDLELPRFEALAAVQCELFDNYPDLRFDFDMLPLAAVDSSLTLHAA